MALAPLLPLAPAKAVKEGLWEGLRVAAAAEGVPGWAVPVPPPPPPAPPPALAVSVALVLGLKEGVGEVVCEGVEDSVGQAVALGEGVAPPLPLAAPTGEGVPRPQLALALGEGQGLALDEGPWLGV